MADSECSIRNFMLSNIYAENRLDHVSENLRFDVNPKELGLPALHQLLLEHVSEQEMQEARQMASYYEAFYCLENFIRNFICDRLQEQHGVDWWEQSVPESVKTSARSNRSKEKKAGITGRSSRPIDFVNFGELGEIIKANWGTFGDTLSDLQAVEKILALINTLRSPIGHSCLLAEDEVARLNLALKDWFRQMS